MNDSDDFLQDLPLALDSQKAYESRCIELINNSLFMKKAKEDGFFDADKASVPLTVMIPSNNAIAFIQKPFSYLWKMHTAPHKHVLDKVGEQGIMTQARMVYGVWVEVEDAEDGGVGSSAGSVCNNTMMIAGVKCFVRNIEYEGCIFHLLEDILPDWRFNDSNLVNSFLPIVPVPASATEYVEMEIQNASKFLASYDMTVNVHTVVEKSTNFECTSTRWKWKSFNRIPITTPSVGVAVNCTVCFTFVHDASSTEVIKFDLPYYIRVHPNPNVIIPPVIHNQYYTDDWNTVLIEGKSLGFNTRIFFGDNEATVISTSDTHVKAVIPSGNGKASVTVKKGEFVTRAKDFAYPN